MIKCEACGYTDDVVVNVSKSDHITLESSNFKKVKIPMVVEGKKIGIDYIDGFACPQCGTLKIKFN